MARKAGTHKERMPAVIDAGAKALEELEQRRAAISSVRERYSGLKPVGKEGYELTRKAIADLRGMRVAIDKRGKELKEDAIKWQRSVNGMVQSLIAEIKAIEDPLQLAKDEVDEAAAREKQRKEDEYRAKIAAEEAAKKAEEEARKKAELDAERERLRVQAEQQAKEKAELAAQRKRMEELQEQARQKVDEELRAAQEEQRKAREKLDQERAAIEAQQKAEADRLAAEQARIDAENRRMERERFERETRERLEHEAKEKAERDRQAAIVAESMRQQEAREEASRKAEAERKERERLEAMRPDVEKIHALATALDDVSFPEVTSESAKAALGEADTMLSNVIGFLRRFEA